MRFGPAKRGGMTNIHSMTSHTVNPKLHVSKGSHAYSGSVESPPTELDPQSAFNAGTLYTNAIRRQDGQGGFPWTRFPWITIAGPQLKQAASLHNIYNANPRIVVENVSNPQTNFDRSPRIRSVLQQFVTKLPVGSGSALGGTS